MANISVFGLGYVGCVGIGCFAKLGHNLIGYDIDSHKVERVSKGLATIVEREIDDLMAEGHAAGRITATNSVEQADRKSTRLNSSHVRISYAVFCLKKK